MNINFYYLEFIGTWVLKSSSAPVVFRVLVEVVFEIPPVVQL